MDVPAGRNHEQRGRRPAIVAAKANGLGVVLPLTTNLNAKKLSHVCRIEPSKENGLREECVALVFQVTSVDQACLVEKIGWLNKKERKPIQNTLKELFKLED